MRTGLYWFTHDLRVDDNPLLRAAAERCDALLCVYVIDPREFEPSRYQGIRPLGEQRWRFICDSLRSLNEHLVSLGQRLHIVAGVPTHNLTTLVQQYQVSEIFTSRPVACDECRQLSALQAELANVEFCVGDTFTLFDQEQLPFSWRDLPATFSQFRKQVENIPVSPPVPAPQSLPPMPFEAALPNVELASESASIPGGIYSGQKHLQEYIWQDHVSRYKTVRNELDGWRNSSKLSPWLAQGCLSPRQINHSIKEYESSRVANESTYWLFFELLWREYFQWYARAHGSRSFRLRGLKQQPPLTSFYPQRFRAWCEGRTPYPLVNAAINQLNDTGYISNRSRQIVASALVNEMQIDWRYGAAYFQQQLIDYDPASNWGNWQYIAGVGADPRGGRHFNLAKQQELFDPHGDYIRRWQGHSGASLDVVDYVDWPLSL